MCIIGFTRFGGARGVTTWISSDACADRVTRWEAKSQGPWTICKKYAMDTKLIFSYFLERVEARNRMYNYNHILSGNNHEQKILVFHDEN